MTQSRPLIAIVDDDESVCRALKRLFLSQGMDATTFYSGQELLDFMETNPLFRPNCVVLDLQMPGANGFDVRDRLTEMEKRIPILFITAHDEAGVRERAMAGGAAGFLRKPLTEDRLIRAVNEILRQGKNGGKNGAS